MDASQVYAPRLSLNHMLSIIRSTESIGLKLVLRQHLSWYGMKDSNETMDGLGGLYSTEKR